ncbi:metallophosphoesterase [Antribacter sp. KLBMP9083]|uniref:Metallophosphoesterase n=1 Tax=Antribacter soli TaxID=2910976 RepID=A0AA41QEC5_9MICO|nr:metallophosphoesterase [Antribacter soli]MCF4121586.1 metallophosphoesterase [Antribacter soli]
MSRPRPVPPRWVRWALASVAVVLACVVFGLTTARAELSLGPHEALYEVTAEDAVVADLGPLGTLEVDSPLPLNLGVTVTVKEIPADLTAVTPAATLNALGGDLDSYLQFFSSPERTVGTVARALLLDAAVRSGVALVVVAGAFLGVRALLGRDRRTELNRVVVPRTWEITASVVLVALVWGSSTASGIAIPDQRGVPASAVFDGTSLQGARITGRLAGVIDTYGGQLVGLYRQNEAFYAGARESLVASWTEWEARAEPPSAPGPDASPTPDTSPAATLPPFPSPTPSPEADLVTLLVVSDLHCNTGMTPLIRELATRADVDAVVNAGDTTMNGTAVESVCVDSFASAVPGGVPMVVSDGNHDSLITSGQERAHGEIVLDGEVVEVAGVRILGDRDPLETRVGAGTTAARAETPAETAQRLADAACEAAGDPGFEGPGTAEERVDLLLVHTPPVGDAALDSGCVPFQISGHTHKRSGPEAVGYGVRYVNASTAGAATGQPTVGPLRGTAEMTLLRFDLASRRFVDWQLVTVTPSGAATVSDRQAVPDPVPYPGEVPPEAGEPAPEPAPTVSP